MGNSAALPRLAVTAFIVILAVLFVARVRPLPPDPRRPAPPPPGESDLTEPGSLQGGGAVPLDPDPRPSPRPAGSALEGNSQAPTGPKDSLMSDPAARGKEPPSAGSAEPDKSPPPVPSWVRKPVLWKDILKAEERKDFREALRLAEEAAHPARPCPGLDRYVRKTSSKMWFAFFTESARKAEKEGTVIDLEVSLTRWRKALKYAGTESEKKEVEARILAASEKLETFTEKVPAGQPRPGGGGETALDRLPESFQERFMMPDSGTDQYGNAVTRQRGSPLDAGTGLPLEVWMKSPRIEFVLVPKGSFWMGSPPEEAGRRPNEGSPRQVKIDESFYMAKYEITRKVWGAVMQRLPEVFEEFPLSAAVTGVSRMDSASFAEKLGLCLPTETQWEHACRAGTRTAVYAGDLSKKRAERTQLLHTIAWWQRNARRSGEQAAGPRPVGRKKPNPFGLYDMIGNAWEWCGAGTGKPTLPAQGILRGGGWRSSARHCRAAARRTCAPDFEGDDQGFRPVLAVP